MRLSDPLQDHRHCLKYLLNGFVVLEAFAFAMSDKREVFVAPGRTLFTVILYSPSSFASVLLQFATAPQLYLKHQDHLMAALRLKLHL